MSDDKPIDLWLDESTLPTPLDMFVAHIDAAKYAIAGMLDTFDNATGGKDEMSIDDAVDWCYVVADMIRDLRMLDTLVRREVKARAGAKKVETAHGLVEIKMETKRTQWRKDELLAHVTARIVELPGVLTDEEGELHPPSVIASNVVHALKGAVSISGGKVTGMRALGLQPDEFCHEDINGYSVVLPKRPDKW